MGSMLAYIYNYIYSSTMDPMGYGITFHNCSILLLGLLQDGIKYNKMNLWGSKIGQLLSHSQAVRSQFYEFVPIGLHPMTILGYNLKDGGLGATIKFVFGLPMFFFSEDGDGMLIQFYSLQRHPLWWCYQYSVLSFMNFNVIPGVENRRNIWKQSQLLDFFCGWFSREIRQRRV